MATHTEELHTIAQELRACSAQLNKDEFAAPLAALEEVITDVSKAWSRSWFGYHANVYYRDLRVPPPGAHFSSEWGMDDAGGMGTRGDWVERDAEDVKQTILRRASTPKLDGPRRAAEDARRTFDDAKARVASILEIEKSGHANDSFLAKLLDEASKSM